MATRSDAFAQVRSRSSAAALVGMIPLFNLLFKNERAKVISYGCCLAFFHIGRLLPIFFLYRVMTGIGVLTERSLVKLGLLGLVSLILLPLYFQVEGLAKAYLRRRLEIGLRRMLLHRLHQAPIEEVEKFPRGEWVGKVIRDVEVVEPLLLQELVPLPGKLFSIFLSAIFILILGGSFGVLVDSVLFLSAIPQVILMRRRAFLEEGLEKLNVESTNLLAESLSGLKTIRCHGAEAHLERRFDEKANELLARELILMRSSRGQESTRSFALCLGFVISCLLICVGVFQNKLKVDQALPLSLLVTCLVVHLRQLMFSLPVWRRLALSGERLKEIAIFPSDSGGARAAVASLEATAAHSMVMKKIVIVKNGSKIGPLDFRLNRGQLWAITGSAGSGKTILLDVASGLRPAASGQLRLEDASGRIMWSSGNSHPYLPTSSVALVEQNPYLFSGTIRENLTFGNTQRLSDTLLWEVLERVGLYDFVRSIGGLESRPFDAGGLRDRGVRYRIALGRAFLLNRPFLMLDEPFAPHDDATIAWIGDTLVEEKKRAGILVVSRSLPRFFSADGVSEIEMWVNVGSARGITVGEHGVHFGYPL